MIEELKARMARTLDEWREFEPEDDWSGYQRDHKLALSALETVPAAPDEDWLEEVISDSLEMDWRPRDAAKAIIARWSESQALAAPEGK
jgi:hypothetical protein